MSPTIDRELVKNIMVHGVSLNFAQTWLITERSVFHVTEKFTFIAKKRRIFKLTLL